MPAATRLLKLNLTRAHAESFDVHFRLPESAETQPDLAQLLANYAPCSVGRVGRGKNAEFILISLTKREQDGPYYARVRFDTVPPFEELVADTLSSPPVGEARAKNAKPGLFLGAVAATGASVELHCRARFEYPLSYAKSLVQLPWKPMISGPMPFDEFRGFRGTKLDADGNVVYSVIVDSLDLKTLAHDVFLYKEVRLSGPFMRPAFREAQRISQLFFTR